jgi:DMSO/TMAO reductase YedYZ molybdopterin-dependent catalytic subunit
LFTDNADFYRVDTAISVPRIRPADYRLSMTGMFDSPRSYTLADLFERDDIMERDVTLTCVSNEIGGTLAGSARWIGVPLGALLRENGVRSESDQLLCRSADGMTIGAPTRSALEVEAAMLAFGMNGEPLPVEHGFPVRMIIPGLYGYVSACKWLTRIEATTFDAVEAYWVQRGWAARGPIKIAARIDTPASLRQFPAGRRAIAGVAWAQTRGIERVEVKVDDEDWADARLSPQVDADLWRQWVLPYDFRPGRHSLTVRATSADGEVQTDARAAPFPDGASGWHSVRVVAG